MAKRNLGKFEVIATGFKKGAEEGPQIPMQSVISRHGRRSQAHQYLMRHLGAEKVGVGHSGKFAKDGLTFHVQPIFPEKKKKKAMKEHSEHKFLIQESTERTKSTVSIIKEAIAKSRKAKKNKEKTSSPGTTMTGQPADRINTDPTLATMRGPTKIIAKSDYAK
jgi:hypothetical protein